jgi:hypothetical protein
VTLVEFLLARLDEDARKARAAETGRRWEALTRADSGPQVRVGDGDMDDPGPEWRREVVHPMWHCDDELDGCPDVARGWIAEAEHIARHDPARVLAEVAAKRLILEYAPPKAHGTFDDGWRRGQMAFHAHTLRLLALPYAGHPDYQEEWKP